MRTIDDFRADTPGCLDRVFLDSAGSSLPPDPVVDTTIGHLRREAEVGGYRAALERLDDLAAVKTSIGRLIGAPAESIALSDSATRSWTDFFYSVPLRPGDRILISRIEYASNAVAALQRARATGATVEEIPSDPSGRVDVDAFAQMLDGRVRLVSLVHVPTNSGLVNPVAKVTELAHQAGALVLLDACQSVGQLHIDAGELGIDALSATGRKWLRGPRGTGFLFVNPALDLEPERIDLNSATWTAPDQFTLVKDASRFEFWEFSVATRLGLGRAVDYLLAAGQSTVYSAIAQNAATLRILLSEIPKVTVQDADGELSGIVTFTVAGTAPTDVRDALASHRVTVSVSHRASTLLDMTARGLDSVVRASPHCFVSREDLLRAANAVREIAG